MAKNYLSIYAKSFNWAGFFLPKIKYKNCSALYDFCRTVDNIVDDEGNLDLKKKNLIEFKKKFFEKDFSSSKIEKMWNLINEFYKITNIPVLLNTSFNINEPIACTEYDCINTFKNSKVNYLFIGNYFVQK